MFKKIITLIFIIVLSGSADGLAAKENGSPRPSARDVRIRRAKQSLSGRPKAPSRQNIFCVYDGEVLDFVFTYSEGECTLVVTNLSSGSVRSYSFDSSDEASVYVGPLNTAKIEIVTSKGNEYEGYIGSEEDYL